MKRLGLLLAVVVFFAPAIAAQDQPPPKPGPEHELLAKKFEGTWDCVMKCTFMPGESKGVQTSKVALGGFFVVGDFKGKIGDGDFQGHTIRGYDTFKKKFTSVWCDSMGSWMMVSTDGVMDKSGKILTESCEGPDMTNTKVIKYKMTTEFKDDNTIVFNMSFPDDKGKEGTMTVTYTRRK